MGRSAFAADLPFFAFAGLSLVGPEAWQGWVSRALIAYGAVILSFLGEHELGMPRSY